MNTGGGSQPLILHATTVAEAGRAVLITGPSGVGKSALALRLLAYGAKLVADDRTALQLHDGAVLASCPAPRLAGVIEARGVGLLSVPHLSAAPLTLVVDLGQDETERLPPRRETMILGVSLPLVLRSQNAHLPEAILLWLQGGRWD